MAAPEGYMSLGMVGFTDKGEYNPEGTYMQNDIVHMNNDLWRCKVDNTVGIEPVENEHWTIFVKSAKELDGIIAIDTHGFIGSENEKVSAQYLINEMGNPSFEDFSTDTATVPDARNAIEALLSGMKLPKFLSNVKAALLGLITLGEMRALLVNNGMCNEAGKFFLDAAFGKTLADTDAELQKQIDEQNSNFENNIGKVITLSDTGVFHITRQTVIEYPTHYDIAITISPTDTPTTDTPGITFPAPIRVCVLPFYVTPDCGGIFYSSGNQLVYRIHGGTIVAGTELIINGIVPKAIT